jgi:hypothetical protein
MTDDASDAHERAQEAVDFAVKHYGEEWVAENIEQWFERTTVRDSIVPLEELDIPGYNDDSDEAEPVDSPPEEE